MRTKYIVLTMTIFGQCYNVLNDKICYSKAPVSQLTNAEVISSEV